MTRGEDLYLKMLLSDGLMHADLHPGNILIDLLEDSKKRNKNDGSSGVGDYTGPNGARIVLVDAGMVASLSGEEQEHFVGLLESMGRGDGRSAAAHVLKFSTEQTCSGDAEKEAFSSSLEAFFSSQCRGYGTDIDLATVLRGVLGLVREHGVRIDVNYATLVMNALCLDGLAKAVLPHYNIMDAAAPLLRAHARYHGLASGSAFGRGFLQRVAIPLAMRRKARHDQGVSRRLARLGLDGSEEDGLTPEAEAMVRRLLTHKT